MTAGFYACQGGAKGCDVDYHENAKDEDNDAKGYYHDDDDAKDDDAANENDDDAVDGKWLG